MKKDETVKEIIEEDDPRLWFLKREEAIVPLSGPIRHIKDSYWVVHPVRGLVFWLIHRVPYPQCNTNEEIVQRYWGSRMPWGTVEKITSVFIRINPQDYE